ncbi:hypothetical protein K438DRAFT_318132 [Mycena galopus ATCC 62051]|nr:hypothetical protein K438DRAFT_318132 [Mycena galopus ATCC 62051]
MSTRSTTPSPNLAVLAPTNSLKRALSDDADSDDGFLPDSKKIKLKSENTSQSKDKKKRKKKKKKTPVVIPLELPSTNATPASVLPIMDSGKGKRKATYGPALQLEVDHPEEDAPESSSAAAARLQSPEIQDPPLEISEDKGGPSTTIARLTLELKTQAILLKKHESTLSQFNQSLTCQVCLDLLHKPFALAPCGHVACYNCLVAWFTSEPEQHHHFGPRKKTCPNCRATIKERPVEVWNIKDMVAALLKSGLVSGTPSTGPPPPPALPGPPQPAGAPPDPWHNIFRYPHQHPMFHPPPAHGGEAPSVEDMGMLDAEDGVYRCLDCMHEIWDGICTSCHREYPGHLIDDDEEIFDDGEMLGDSDGEEDPIFWPYFLPIPGPVGLPGQWWNAADDDEDDDDENESELERAIQEAEAEDGYDSFIDDSEDGVEQAAAIIEIDDDGSDDGHGSGSSPPPVAHRRRPAPANSRIVISSDDEDENEDVPDRRSGRRRNRISSPVESEVIVVSGDESDHASRRDTSRRSRSRIVHDHDEDESRG